MTPPGMADMFAKKLAVGRGKQPYEALIPLHLDLPPDGADRDEC